MQKWSLTTTTAAATPQEPSTVRMRKRNTMGFCNWYCLLDIIRVLTGDERDATFGTHI